MLESRLLEHLKVLDITESNDFLHFAKSMTSYAKDTPEETYVLLKYLLKNTDAEKKLSKEIVYAHVFPKQVWKNGKIEKLMSAALKVFKNFIQYKKYIETADEINETLAMSEFYRKKQLHKLFEQNVKQLAKYKEENNIKDAPVLYNEYLIETTLHAYQTEFYTRKDDLNLPQTIFALDIFYLVKRLDFTLNALIQNKYTPFDNDYEKFMAAIYSVLALAVHSDYAENHLIQLLIDAIQLQRLQDSEEKQVVFNRFEKKLNASRDYIDKEHYTTFCIITRNYFTQEYNHGNLEILPILFELFAKHLSEGVLYVDNFIRASTMQNIIINALKLKKTDFVKTFLEEHKGRISGTKQPDLVWEYNLAFYYFEIGNHQIAAETLPNYLDLQDAYYALAARRLEIKIHNELDLSSKYDLVGNKIDAFKNFLFESKKNNRISEQIFDMNNDFTDFVKQIRNTVKGDERRVEKLLVKLNQIESGIAEREWLTEKIEGLRR
jgi:hypothetical protein